jgi:hypothetical protein
MFELRLTPQAQKDLHRVRADRGNPTVRKSIDKTLGYLALNPRHPGLRSHEHTRLTALSGVKVWESYAQNQTSNAYRIFWHYGPDKNIITVLAITGHP